MDAIVSGQAGVAVVIRGNSTSVVEASRPNAELPCAHTYVPLLLHNVPDAIHLHDVTESDIATHLEQESDCDTALQLALILLDGTEDIDTRADAAEPLNDLLAMAKVNDFVANRLYSAPLPDAVDLDSIWQRFAAFDRVINLLYEVATRQREICLFSESWERLPLDLFSNSPTKESFRETLTRLGAIRDLVKAGQDRTAFDTARLACHQELQWMANSRMILSTWLDEFVPERAKRLLVEDVPEQVDSTPKESGWTRWSRFDAIAHTKRMYEASVSVAGQKDVIMDLANNANWGTVERYSKQLVEFQLQNGGPAYASKSLCHLAQHAKSLRNYSKQLEFAQWATRVKPDDGWAHGQVADAYVCLGQFDNALQALSRAEAQGEERFAATERGRILRCKAELSEALQTFQNATERFPEEPVAWNGRAEVLRDMWRLDDALAAYEAAADRFPYERIAKCGIGAVLTDLGEFDRAIKVYEDVGVQLGEDVVSASGYAHVLAKMGRLDDALLAFDDAIRKFPDELAPRCGHANVLKDMGHVQRSLTEFDAIVSEFRHEPIAICGRAEILKAMSRYKESLDDYQKAKEQFPWVAWAWNGYASVLKRSCRFEESLQAYDDAVKRFPYNAIALSGRADLLKQLGSLDDAIGAYEQVLQLTKNKIAAQHSMAAIMVAQGRFQEALELLGKETRPRTRDEWIAHHVRGMILLRTEKVEEAIVHFQFGSESCPFASGRKYFDGALAVANLRLNRYCNAAALVEDSETPFADLIRIHAFGALSRTAEAEAAYGRVKNHCPPLLGPLRDELVARYLPSNLPMSHSTDWVLEQECAGAGLMAA